MNVLLDPLHLLKDQLHALTIVQCSLSRLAPLLQRNVRHLPQKSVTTPLRPGLPVLLVLLQVIAVLLRARTELRPWLEKTRARTGLLLQLAPSIAPLES